MQNWLILVHRIPPRPLYLRAKMRQRLAAAGAIAVKNAVYLLPENADTLEDLQWIAQEIEAGGGDAHLFRGDFVEGVASEAALAQFREARDADYERIASDARALLSDSGESELAAAQAKLARRFEEIRRIDFFDAPKRAAAERALAQVERRLARRRREEEKMIKAHPELRGKTWVTRQGVKVDRMASIWLIRRFLDPKARFRFVEERSARAAEGEVRFDMIGGEFSHEEDRCTFETLVRRFALTDRGVKAIAEIVHDIDLKESRFARPETAGVRALLDGIIARTDSDDERCERAMAIFDDLHEALGRTSRRSKA